MVFGIPVRPCNEGGGNFNDFEFLPAAIKTWSLILGCVAAVAAVASVGTSARLCRRACARQKERVAEVTEGVQHLINVRRLAQLEAVMFASASRAPLALGVAAGLLLTGTVPDPMMFCVLFSIQVCGTIVATVYSLLPQLCTISADMISTGFVLLASIIPCFATSTDMYQPMVSLVRVVWTMMACAGPNPMLFIPLNLCHCTLQIVTIVYLPLGIEALIVNIFTAVLTTLLAIGAGIGSRSTLFEMALAQVKAEKLRNMEAAVRAILDMVCHAFVPLNEALQFRDDSPALAALLLRPAAAKAGDDFLQYVKEADRSRLSTFVEAGHEMAFLNKAQQICITLLGAQGQEIFIRIYHFCHVDLITKGLTHFFGILEEDPELLAAPKSLTKLSEPAVQVSFPPPARESESATPQRSLHSQQAPEEAVITTWRIEGKPAKLKVKTWLHWELLEESEACRTLFNFVEDAQHPEELLARVQDPEPFLRHVEALHFLALAGHDISKQRLENVQLWSPDRTLCYQTNIRADVTSGLVTEEGEEAEVPSDNKKDMRAVEMVLTLSQPRSREAAKMQMREQRREDFKASQAAASAASDGTWSASDPPAQTLGARFSRL